MNKKRTIITMMKINKIITTESNRIMIKTKIKMMRIIIIFSNLMIKILMNKMRGIQINKYIEINMDIKQQISKKKIFKLKTYSCQKINCKVCLIVVKVRLTMIFNSI